MCPHIDTSGVFFGWVGLTPKQGHKLRQQYAEDGTRKRQEKQNEITTLTVKQDEHQRELDEANSESFCFAFQWR